MSATPVSPWVDDDPPPSPDAWRTAFHRAAKSGFSFERAWEIASAEERYAWESPGGPAPASRAEREAAEARRLADERAWEARVSARMAAPGAEAGAGFAVHEDGSILPEADADDGGLLPSASVAEARLAAHERAAARLRDGAARGELPGLLPEGERLALEGALALADAEAAEPDEGQVARRASAWVFACKNKTGRVTSGPSARKANDHKSRMLKTDYALAAKLKAAGVSPFQKNPREMTIIGCYSGLTETIPTFRNLVLFGSVARRKRAKTLRELMHWLSSKKRMRETAHWVFTAGPRIPLCEGKKVRAAFEQLGRKISKLNAAPFMKRLGVQVILRQSETGDLVEKRADANGVSRRFVKVDEKGRVLVHAHAHVLLHKSRWLTCDEALELHREIEAHMGALCSPDGVLQSPREACKYVTKTADLTALSPEQLRLVHENLFRAHLCQPLGALRERIRARWENCRKVETRFDGKRTRYDDVADWNATKGSRRLSARQRREQRERRALERAREARAKRAAAVKAAMRGEAPGGDAGGGFRLEVQAAPRKQRENVFLARLSPAPFFGRVAEPAVLVMNYNAATFPAAYEAFKSRCLSWGDWDGHLAALYEKGCREAAADAAARVGSHLHLICPSAGAGEPATGPPGDEFYGPAEFAAPVDEQKQEVYT
jgi:hypothetical protein